MRADLDRIRAWIKPNSRVLDLGCGDGTLLANLQKNLDIKGYGIERDDAKIAPCIAKGLNVIQADLNDGLAQYFDDHSFDYVVMSLTLQATRRPDRMVIEMLRVGQEAIVTFPNHGFWRNRYQLALQGVMPVTRSMPHDWYDTPNTHLCTLRDFELFCKNQDIHILQREVVNNEHEQSRLMNYFPNVFGEIAIYHISKD
ncbi:MAG TPA: methionine biosynthesis protein MetW [Thiothrix sp.]|nr:methionine biosynthesis protein MetW [Thiothrix sp.]